MLEPKVHLNPMHTATKSSKIDISTESKTANIASKLSDILKKGDVLFLYGEIGLGKTTLIRNLINIIQKKENLPTTEILSPTFNLVNEYQIKDLVIMHYDLFRIKNIDETKSIGLFENYKEALTLIEWPEKISIKPKERIELYFEYNDNLDKRFLTIKDYGSYNIKGLFE